MINEPLHYCPNCLCESCVHWTMVLAAHQRRLASIEYNYRKGLEEQRARRISRDRLADMEGGMIWLLINAIIERGDGMKLPSVIDMLANLMVYRVGEVSKKRQRFAQRFLTAAEAAYPGTGWYERLVEAGSLGRNTVEEPWTKPAGTRGTELPEWCEHCDRILPSKRQGFKRVPCPCRKGKT